MGKAGRRRRRHNLRGDAVVRDNPPVANNNQPTVPLGIPFPPDDIFKHRRRRINVAQQIFANSVSYIPGYGKYIKQEDGRWKVITDQHDNRRVEYSEERPPEGAGTFVYYFGYRDKDHDMPAPKFPARCVAPADAIYAVDPVKRNFINQLRLFTSKEFRLPFLTAVVFGFGGVLNKICELFNSQANLSLYPFYLDDGYYCPVGQEIINFVRVVLTELGVNPEVAKQTAENIGCMFEYDNAYRFRLQDVLDSADQHALIHHFPKEAERLIFLEESRENLVNNDVTEKFKKGVSLLKSAWYIPKFRRAIKRGLEAMDFAKVKLEEGDIYHMLLYGDYNVKGLPLDQRLAIYKSYHGEDQAKWPPRIQVVQ